MFQLMLDASSVNDLIWTFFVSFVLSLFCSFVRVFFLSFLEFEKNLVIAYHSLYLSLFFLSLFHLFSCSIVLLLELWGFKDVAINYNHKGFLPFTHFIGKFKCRLKLQCTKTAVRSKLTIVQCIKLKELSQH